MFWSAWAKAITKSNIHSGWEKVGLVPFNPERVLKRFEKVNDERPSSSESSNSVLKPEDWKCIEQLLKETVTNFHNNRAIQLTRTVHHLTTKNTLLKMQVRGLEKALELEQKRRQ